MLAGRPTCYVCVGPVCLAPLTDAAALAACLEQAVLVGDEITPRSAEGG